MKLRIAASYRIQMYHDSLQQIVVARRRLPLDAQCTDHSPSPSLFWSTHSRSFQPTARISAPWLRSCLVQKVIDYRAKTRAPYKSRSNFSRAVQSFGAGPSQTGQSDLRQSFKLDDVYLLQQGQALCATIPRDPSPGDSDAI